jgi:tRNA pseudouridine13 synthase
MVAVEQVGDPTLALPFAHGGPVLRGRLRARDEDFQVEEVLGYGPSGDGEHVFLKLRKRGRNTHDVARMLARHAGVAQVAVGYAGLKDRNAVTTQSFTVQMPGQDTPDWSAVCDDGLQILDVARHHRKIRRGGLRGNRFVIRVTGVSGPREVAEQRLQLIAERGVPNYFGSQRFGRGGSNLQRAAALFSGSGRRPGREQRGLILSAARAQLFNQVLAARVAACNWDIGLPGDVMSLAGSGRQFHYDAEDASLAERVQRLDVHPTGPLCGRSSRALAAGADSALIERPVLAEWQAWIDGLERFGLDADRRALRLAVDALDWSWQEEALTVSFELTAGAYATSVLRELVGPDDEASETTVLA